MATSSTRIDTLDRLFEPLGRCLTPEVARNIADLRADAARQARLDVLAGKASEGTLSSDERAECKTYVRAIDFISVLQAKARAVLKDCPKL